MTGFFKMLDISSWGRSSSGSWEPLSLGDGDAGCGMRLRVETVKPDPNHITIKVKYAPANLYASLIEKGCRTGPQEQWLLYVDVDGTLRGFHFASATWHKVKFSVAGQECIRKAWSGGGARILLDLELHNKLRTVNRTLKLWNPVTGSLCKLPPFKAIRAPCAFGLSRDKIIAAGLDEKDVYTWVEIFSTGGASWCALGSLPRPYALRLEHIVECKGNFYALFMFPDHHMLEIRPQQGPNYFYVCATPQVWQAALVNCQGTLYFVGVNLEDDMVRIWKLCESRWEEVARPVSPCANIARHLTSIISVGNSLIFCLRNHQMLSFDLAKSAWTSLPLCPEPSYNALRWTPAPNDTTL